MPYFNTVPQATQRISASQPEIQFNFGEIDLDFARNHVSLVSAQAANRGKHNLVQFVTQQPLPVVQPVAPTEIGMYNKVPQAPFPLTGLQELFFKIPGHGVGGALMDIPITALGRTANGWCYLPNGLLIKWGEAFSGVAHAEQAFPTNPPGTIPAFNGILQGFVTPHRINVHNYVVCLYDVTATGISVNGYEIPGGALVSAFFNYLVIGY